MQKKAIECIRQWGKDNRIFDTFDLFVFGSIVDDQGNAFLPQSSDIDLILAFKSRDLNINHRLAEIINLRTKISHLEVLFLRLFVRKNADKPIISAIPLTYIESKYSIHKIGDGSLLSAPRFIKIGRRKSLDIYRAIISTSDDFHEFEKRNKEISSAIRSVQEFRNLYLSQSPNSKIFIEDFDDESDPLPKKMMREAAKLAWAKSNNGNTEDRENVRLGLDFVGEILKTASKENSLTASLTTAFSVRRQGRGRRRGITAEEQLFLWELIFESANLSAVATFQDFMQDILDAGESMLK